MVKTPQTIIFVLLLATLAVFSVVVPAPATGHVNQIGEQKSFQK